MTGPWKDTHEGVMWTKPKGADHWTPSVRIDELWFAKRDERRTFVELCHEWRKAAEADGWVFTPTYGDHEPVEQAFRGERDGFVISGIARPGCDEGRDMSLPTASIHIWGPDRGAIDPPLVYDMAAIRAAADKCPECGTIGRQMVVVGFANRCCVACEPALRKAIEVPGWCD